MWVMTKVEGGRGGDVGDGDGAGEKVNEQQASWNLPGSSEDKRSARSSANHNQLVQYRHRPAAQRLHEHFPLRQQKFIDAE